MRYILLILLYFPTISLADTTALWDIQHLMNDLASVKEKRAKFVEQKYLKVLKQPLESSGTLLFQAPARLEKITLHPKAESFIFDQDVLSIHIESRNIKRTLKLHDYPEIGAFIESIRATLAGDLSALTRFYSYQLEGNATHWQLTLLPIESKFRKVVSEIHLIGHGAHVDSIKTIDTNGDHTVMKITEDLQ